jgi:hypothetical protein
VKNDLYFVCMFFFPNKRMLTISFFIRKRNNNNFLSMVRSIFILLCASTHRD